MTTVRDTPIGDIRPYARNPRKNDQAVEAVARSIKQFGFKVPIVVDRDGVIVAGHTRYKAAQALGMATVPVIVADDLTEDQVKAFRLVDNKTAELAEWDLDLLPLELDEIEMDLEPFGFVQEVAIDVEEDDYEVEIPEEPSSRVGDMYLMGDHVLLVGDSTSSADVDRLMGGELADMVFTDPPWNVAIEGGTDEHLTILNDDMDATAFREFLDAVAERLSEHLRGGGRFMSSWPSNGGGA